MRNHLLRPLAVAAALAVCIAGCSSNSGSNASGSATKSAPSKFKVAVLTQTVTAGVTEEENAFKSRLTSQSGGKSFEWADFNAEGDTARCNTLARQLSGNYDLIVGIGTLCIVAMANNDHKTPIIALGMGDPVGSAVAKSAKAPGGNVTGSYRGDDPGGVFFNEMYKTSPKPKTVGFIYDQSNETMVKFANGIKAAATKVGVTTILKGVTDTGQVATTARALAPQVNAMMVGPDGTILTSFPALVSADNQAGIPTFSSGLGLPGVVADIGNSFTEYGQAGATAAKSVLIDGHSPATTPFVAADTPVWQIDNTAVQKFNVVIPAKILSGATQIKQ